MRIYDLVGLEVEVREHSDPTLRGVKGVVLDESENFLIMEKGGRVIMVYKPNGIYAIHLGNFNTIVKGSDIASKPMNRLRKGRSLEW